MSGLIFLNSLTIRVSFFTHAASSRSGKKRSVGKLLDGFGCFSLQELQIAKPSFQKLNLNGSTRVKMPDRPQKFCALNEGQFSRLTHHAGCEGALPSLLKTLPSSERSSPGAMELYCRQTLVDLATQRLLASGNVRTHLFASAPFCSAEASVFAISANAITDANSAIE
jgi:hypothetical protein